MVFYADRSIVTINIFRHDGGGGSGYNVPLSLRVPVGVQTEDKTVLWWRTVRQGRRYVQRGVRLVGDDYGRLGCPDGPGRGSEAQVVTDHSPAGGGGPEGLAHHGLPALTDRHPVDGDLGGAADVEDALGYLDCLDWLDRTDTA